MPRPRKCRRVCNLPPVGEYIASGKEQNEYITLTVDEFECIRLIDHRNLSQESAAEYMQVSRATAQLIYDSARKKLAEALVLGVGLKIEGGDYRLCDGRESGCAAFGCQGCCK